MNGGRAARTAGLIITTSMATAAVQQTVWTEGLQLFITVLCIVIGAFLGAMAADFDGARS